MEASVLANEMRVRCLPKHVPTFLGLDDQQTIQQGVSCPDCGDCLVHPERLPAIVERSTSFQNFAANIAGVQFVGFFTEEEQDVLQDHFKAAVHSAAQQVIYDRGLEFVPQHVYDAFVAEAAFFAKRAFRNANN